MEELTPGQLRRQCDLSGLDFETTAELEPLDEVIGQPRAVAAIELAVGMTAPGYNLFVLGPDGVGKRHLVDHVLARCRRDRATPPDLCYVHNFERPERPIGLSLPAGRGTMLVADMQQLVTDLQVSLVAAFDSDEYQTRQQLLHDEFHAKQEEALDEVQKRAADSGLGMLRSPSGIVFAPVRDGEVLPRQEFDELPEEERARIGETIEALSQELADIAERFPQWHRRWQQEVREHNEETTRTIVPKLMAPIRARYADQADVIAYFEAVEADVVEHASDLIAAGRSEDGQAETLFLQQISDGFSATRYEINLLVDHRLDEAAPVVCEAHPTLQNLVGRVEHTSRMGALSTDFRLIRAGALHRANGGYLVLDARRLLSQAYAWEGLKRALESREIRFESLGETLGLVATVSLEPEPLPLDVKVVLVGDRRTYYLLSELDPEFSRLFKIAADFADVLDRTPESEALFARAISTIARGDSLRSIEKGAVARVVEHGSRLAGDAEKLTCHFREIADLLREADHVAASSERERITVGDVQRAIDDRIFRNDRVRERLEEQAIRGTVVIDTSGRQVGQLNGLSVMELGDFHFGRPSRITAQVRLGKGDVVDIEREVELGGPLHSKGVFILAAFLGARYAADGPLPLHASIVFEQSYGGVDGDSASAAELLALLSAIAQVPLRQDLAVTGSIDQHGRVQAIGGVNEKIEGFFDLCNRRGLTGEQGVVIPAANIAHLMLRSDIVDAVAAGRFHIHAVRVIDEALELFTGSSAGSVNDQIGVRLEYLRARLADLDSSSSKEPR